MAPDPGTPTDGLTAGQLRALLADLPADHLILVDGYEGGYSPVAQVQQRQVQQLAGRPPWLGRFDDVDAAAGEAGDEPTVLEPRPTLQGNPCPAVVLRRETGD